MSNQCLAIDARLCRCILDQRRFDLALDPRVDVALLTIVDGLTLARVL